MKKLLLIFLVILFTFEGFAQKLRFNAYGSYVFYNASGSFYNIHSYNIMINGGPQWGAGFEYIPHKQVGLELMYLRQNTRASYYYSAGSGNTVYNPNANLGLNYILLGGDTHMPIHNGKLEGYLGGFAGVLIANIENPGNGYHTTVTKFSWASRAGINFWVKNRVGLKLQAQLISTLNSNASDRSTVNTGSNPDVSMYTNLYQIGVGCGLTYKLGKK
jgi:hypothetical protein